MPKFIVETSARHVHVTQETLETLFGKGATLTKKKARSGLLFLQDRGQKHLQALSQDLQL